ncbi:MAG TPA: porin family protein [Chitinophagaceae bacterium]|nr:porin family protein [Chitinophagaceae bacterium]
MKKISVIVTALLLSTSLLFAQDPKFGIKGGLNISKLTNQGSDPDWRLGFNAGLLAHIHVTPAFSLQPEVVYSSQGAKYALSNSKDLNLNLSYLNIPVLLQYNFDNGFRLQGGPQIGFLIGVNDKVDGVELNSVDSDDFKTIDISLPLGFSYLGYSGFGFDARYNLGLTNVIEGSTTNVRNSVIQFGVFYLFDHKHKARSK